MYTMLSFAGRNLRVFFRQKSSVFFSLLGVLMVIGLYVLFLGDVWKESFQDVPKISNLLNSWIIAGIVSITAVTTTLGAFEIMIEDKANKNIKDFYSSPVSRTRIVGGYIISAYVIGLLMSVFALFLGQLYIMLSGGAMLPIADMLKILLVILLSTLSSSAMIFFIVTFFKSNSAFATASTIIGTLVGFLTGIYLPIGSLPEGVKWIIKLFPPSHAGAIIRQLMMKAPIEESFAGVPEAIVTSFKETMGVTYSYGDYTMTIPIHLLVLAATAIVFFLLAVWNASRKLK